MNSKGIFYWVITLLLSQQIFAQSAVISGVITDDQGEPIPAATVMEQGTTNGTVSNLDGEFNLKVSNLDATVVVSFVGFETQKIQLNGRTVVNVVLELDIQEMEAVVVTALGVERDKRSLGYASQSVDGEELTTARESNVINSLSGRVAGVQINQSGTGPGGTSKVVIRGFSSLQGRNSPLYVVDGVPMANPQGGGGQFGGIDYGDGISNINPEDIESISVLKGAGATNLYGSRGQNGVVMITTKKGKARKGVGIEINSNLTFETPLVLPDFQNDYGRGSNGEILVDANGQIRDNVRTSWGAPSQGQTDVNGQPLLNWAGDQVPYNAQPDNIKDFFRTGVAYSNSVGITTGNEDIQVRGSITHMHRDNIMPNSELERIITSLNVSSDLSDRLKFSGKINYINQTAFNRPNLTLSPDNPMSALIEMPRTIRLQDLQNFQNPDGTPRLYNNGAATTWQNPYWAVNLNTNEDERDRMLGFMMLEYRLTDWLKAHVRSGTDFYNDHREVRNATNTIYRVTSDKSFYSQAYNRVQESNSDFLLTASLPLNNNWNGTLTAGGNVLKSRARGVYNEAQGLDVPNLFALQNANSVQARESYSEKVVYSLYGTAQVDYNDKIFLEVGARNDWSSALPPDAWSYFYPSASTSLVLSELLDLPTFISFGKVRASWAAVGNDPNPYQLDLLYPSNSLSHGGQGFGQVATTRPPLDLKPERTTSIEAGLELSLLNNRITFDATYYDAGTKNQIINVPVSKPSGFETAVFNSGLIRNYGVELALNATVVEKPRFRYNTYINFTRNVSVVEELAPDVLVYPLGGNYDQFGVRIQATVGNPFGDIYADKAYLRDESTGERIIGDNGLPIPDPDGIKKIGNYLPDFLAGFGHSLQIGDVSAGVLFDIRKGGDIYSFTNSASAWNGNAAYTLDQRREWYAGAGGYIAEGVRQDGSPNTIEVDPQTYWQTVGGRASNFAEEFLYDGSYVKLREVTIGYSLPKSMFMKSPFHAASISLVGRNLFILYKNTPGFDPEATFNAGNDQGIEAYAFPSTRSYGFNLKLTL
ncbi:SusC/RagA family TonB-linked outer membrane protein [Marinoscillum furvescens]|uniref:TonB-linked SusC/RagA family outer membrane protein n=1 Tax=Marinoscillum furvescens DSM 4134 TaxID=1122208 RepID=A0A3D9KZB6_MARFU|nr:SusC/RagA family TonB-linked outer membrane protein [Marinoscillum furvescens]RED93606.1 TonB-linked SusC/RagA family outer membrane protein [Marinoscillum furvescens DSM 4134]